MKTHPNTKSHVHSTMSFLVSIAVISLLAVGAQGADNQPRLKRIKQLTVIDAHQKVVGRFDPFPTGFCGSAVSYEIEGRIFPVFVNKTGFIHCPNISFFFKSTDCSGPPFVEADTSAFVENARVGEPGNTVYLPNLDKLQQDFQSHSLMVFGSCNTADNTLDAAPEIAIIDLDTVFTPPFEIR